MGQREIDYLLLGPLRALRDGVVQDIGAGRERAVLATLLLRADEFVSVDEIVERVWGNEPPRVPAATVQTYIARLRKKLGDAVTTRPGGYELRTSRRDLDRFRAAVRAADAARRTDDPDAERGQLRTALALWRGEVLSDVPSESLHREVIPGLVEELLLVLERRIDLDLRLGGNTGLISELRAHTATYPLRERFWAQLIRALTQAGRPAEALAAFGTVRRVLAEQLGTSPGDELRRLHHDLLNGPARRPTARALPRDLADFTGRSEALHAAQALARPGRLLLIDGMGGVGKTAFAVHLAHRLASQFPDGQLYVDLYGYTPAQRPVPAEAALSVLLSGLGLPDAQLPANGDARVARWRAETAERRLLIVVDNVRTEQQIRPLLPAGSGCLTVVVSRRRLSLPDTDADALTLDALPDADAAELFRRASGLAPGTPVDTVLALCGNLPLALRLAAVRLRHRPKWTVDDLAKRLVEEHQQHADRGVDATFALSYRYLPPGPRRLFTLLGLMPTHRFDRHAASALADEPPAKVDAHLELLLDEHLLQQADADSYRFHDLVQGFARDRAEGELAPDEGSLASTRLLDYYLYMADQVHRQLSPNRVIGPPALAYQPIDPPLLASAPDALAWAAGERANLLDVIHAAYRLGCDAPAWQLAFRLFPFYYAHHLTDDWVDAFEVAVAATERLDDRANEAKVRSCLGAGYTNLGRFADAIDQHTVALARIREVGDRRAETAVLNNLAEPLLYLERYQEACDVVTEAVEVGRETGATVVLGIALSTLTDTLYELGCYEQALATAIEDLELFTRLDEPRWCGVTWAKRARVLAALHRSDEALVAYDEATRIFEEYGEVSGLIMALNFRGRTMLALGRPDAARADHQRALELCRQVSYPLEQAHALDGIATALDALGDPSGARPHWQQALDIYTRLGVPAADRLRDRLAASISGRGSSSPP